MASSVPLAVITDVCIAQLIARANEQQITLLYIHLGKSTQNAHIERFNRAVRHEWLVLYLFESVKQAQHAAEQLFWTRNNERPHTKIGGPS